MNILVKKLDSLLFSDRKIHFFIFKDQLISTENCANAPNFCEAILQLPLFLVTFIENVNILHLQIEIT